MLGGDEKNAILPIGQPNPMEADDVKDEKGQFSGVYDDYRSSAIDRDRPGSPLSLVGDYRNIRSHIWGRVVGHKIIP